MYRGVESGQYGDKPGDMLSLWMTGKDSVW